MAQERKVEQLQIRVSLAEKRAIQDRARRSGMGMSEWALARLLPKHPERFQELVLALARAGRSAALGRGRSDEAGMVFAELLEFLAPLSPRAFALAVAEPPREPLDAYWSNYLAATVEHGAARAGVAAPEWTRAIAPLEEPAFGSSLASLRLHLLANSPPAFARRNLFIGATLGGRV